jgi:MFS family permease
VGRKRRNWTGADQRWQEPPTHAVPAPDEDFRRTQPVHRNPPHAPQRQLPPERHRPQPQPRNWRDVPPPQPKQPAQQHPAPHPSPPRPAQHPSAQRPSAQRPSAQRPPTRRLEPEELPDAEPRPGRMETYGDVDPAYRSGAPQYPHPRKLTVTRVAALRSRQLTSQAVAAFRRATRADGADQSGLTALTYATMINYASDAAMAVALANVLFFSPTSTDSSKGKVLLYLLITVAPFALIAPVIGPMLDRIQHGRRMAMCAASVGQALMCLLMATNFDTWLIYPGALGKMVLSKSFTVLKAAVTPRVVPPDITLAKTNARLTVFGLAAGLVCGAVAALFANIFGSPGALWLTVLICLLGGVQALRIPSWVEVTEGEVPASLSAHPDKPRRQPMGRNVVVALAGNATIRVLTGFLMMFAAFAVRAQHEGAAFTQLMLLGLIAGAAGVGSFAGNAIGARVTVGHPQTVVIGSLIGALVATVIATIAPGVGTAALVGLVGATGSALSKNSLDAVIQDDLPDESRASAFGRSETALQLTWVFGGAVGLLLPPTYWVGFLVVSVLLAVGLAQTILSQRGATLVPGLGGDRPIRPWRTDSAPHRQPEPRTVPTDRDASGHP